MFTETPFLKPALAAFAAAFALNSLAAPLVKTEHVEAELVLDTASVQPGKPVLVGLKLRMEPHWHTYWKNPGDSGLPTKIQWVLPEGWKAGPIEWPYPQNLPVGPLMNYGYEDEVVLLTTITAPADAKAGSVPVKAKADWLVCKDICIPEKGELDIALTVAASEAARHPRWEAHFDRARRMLPVDVKGWKYESALQGNALVVRLTPPEGAAVPAKATFFPEREGLIEPAAPQKLTRDGRALRIEMKLTDPPLAGVQAVKGVAVSESGWTGSDGHKAINVDAPITTTLTAASATPGTDPEPGPGISQGPSPSSSFVALFFAFIGGLLLNLMPCVFPVLGIKVMGFVEHAHGEPRAMRMQGVVYSGGVLLSFLLLAGLMLALRASGTQLGWGFQLQSPLVVTALSILFFVLALNLSGVFEWGAFAQSLTSNLSARGRYADAFLSGILATVVATPCTAPFMGAAVGFTLTQDALLSLAVFATVGLGMAAPVLALSCFPALLKKLPRPGAWMETFKQVLAFPLYATTVWLAWVLGALGGIDAMLALLMGLVLVAMAAWIYGRWRHAGIWQPATALVLGACGILIAWPGPAQTSATEAAPVAKAGELPWEAWSPEKVASLTGAGKPVFVDFTAAWCVTCQVNKRVALHNAAVVKAFAAHDVVPLKADWTRQDPRITATLASLGRNAVPVYAIYSPGDDTPRLLPEVLTPSLVLDEISKLPQPRTATALSQR
jgi:thiol:disulfide interchange protein/DsbC/DsbD-like thiol-disulfide interchange protein